MLMEPATLQSAPIGIIDSGIGGLTVAKSIQEGLPGESFIFFGDTAHVPFGDKSSHSIKKYTARIMNFLIYDRQCKCIVVACNTASAIASGYLNEINRKQGAPPVINVIDPVVNYIANNKLQLGRIGVIGTKRTIASRAYPNRIKKLLPQAKVVSRSTPLLAPMIEEGFFNNNISQTIINAYLSWHGFKYLDALILGCTHYPYIKPEVERYFKGDVFVVEGGKIVADQLKNTLREADLLNENSEKSGENEFLVSDFTHSFQKTTEIFFGKEVKLKEYPIWK